VAPSGQARQRPLRKRKLVVEAWCSAACTLAPSVKVLKAERVRLRAGKVSIAGTGRKRLTFRLSRKAVGALRKAMRRRKRLNAVVTVTATGGGGPVKATRRITLKR